MQIKGGLKRLNNQCPNIRTYNIQDIYDHGLMTTEPRYILNNLSNVYIFDAFRRHYSRAAFNLTCSCLINVIFFKVTSVIDILHENKTMMPNCIS